MYERSAIVLERYFDNILGYSSENNLKVNFDNYCDLIEKIEQFQKAYADEENSIQEFDNVTGRLEGIQKNEEKLYKKSAKLEFNRNLLFTNIDGKPEETEKCIIKIENDVEKNKEALKNLRVDFINTLNEYKEKSKVLAKNKKAKKEAEKAFKESLQIAKENVDNINEFNLEFSRKFDGSEIKDKLLKLMIDNGKAEKIPFDEGVMSHAADLGMEITQKEVQCYVDIYDNILRVFDEVEKNDVKLDKFKKRLRNIKVKLNFLFAEKDYLTQFLDYERMTVISGKRTHKKLMQQACENFEADLIQINNLYELILKEIAYKSSKKAYKELYNKSYLLDIKKQEATFKREKYKVNINVATVVDSNYWRIEGIKNIYTVFYNAISEVFGKDVDEFDVPDEEENDIEEIVEENDEENSMNSEETTVEETIVEKMLTEDISDFDDEVEEDESKETIQEIDENEFKEETDDYKVKDIHESVVESREIPNKKSIRKFVDEDIPYEEDDQEYEVEEEEESLFGNITSARNLRKEKNGIYDLESLQEKKDKKSSKKGIFKSLIRLNSKNGKKVVN